MHGYVYVGPVQTDRRYFYWKFKKDKNANHTVNADLCLFSCCYFFDASSLSKEERIQFRKGEAITGNCLTLCSE